MHPVVGELTVDYETFVLPGDSDQALYLTTEPGSPSRQAISILASWSQPAREPESEPSEGVKGGLAGTRPPKHISSSRIGASTTRPRPDREVDVGGHEA